MTAVRDDLRELNVAIGAAEKAHDLQLLRELPDDGLIFRRADGRVVGKSDYLAARKENIRHAQHRGPGRRQKGGSAVVTSLVTASGRSDA